MLCLEKQSRPSLLDGATENISFQVLQKKKLNKLSDFFLYVYYFLVSRDIIDVIFFQGDGFFFFITIPEN